MKLPVVLFFGSLALNAALFVVQFQRSPSGFRKPLPGHEGSLPTAGRPGQAGGEFSPTGRSAPQSTKASGPAAVGWAAIDTGDLRELPARLRASGFPPATIRAIVTNRIDALFAPRMKALTDSIAETPIWKQDPRAAVGTTFEEGRNQLMLERTRMLRDVLGGDLTAWTDDPAAARRRQFGDVPPDKIDLVQRITEDYAEMASQVRASMQGITLPEDREKLALLDREKHADLAAILGPKELAGYEMRTSPVTARLRPALTVMDASEEEFRTIFRIYESFNERINLTAMAGGGVLALGTNTLAQRSEATAEMMAQLKAALPPDRYAAYARAQDREFQQLDTIARQNNIPAETAVRAYNLRDHYSAASNRVIDDRALSQEQKRTALQTLATEARTQIMGTLGPAAGASYTQSSAWLNAMDAGRAFTPRPEGGITQRMAPIPPPTKK